jgi:hypothetical protein
MGPDFSLLAFVLVGVSIAVLSRVFRLLFRGQFTPVVETMAAIVAAYVTVLVVMYGLFKDDVIQFSVYRNSSVLAVIAVLIAQIVWLAAESKNGQDEE